MAIFPKDLDKLIGYTMVLSSTVDAAECQRRLHADFSDAKGRIQHAHSDKKLTGRFMDDQFVIVYPLLAFTASVSLGLKVELKPSS